MDKAELLLEAIKLASTLITYAQKMAGDQTVLEAIVAKAHAEGRSVDGADIAQTIMAMDASRATLEAKLAG